MYKKNIKAKKEKHYWEIFETSLWTFEKKVILLSSG